MGIAANDDSRLLTDDAICQLIEDYVAAARMAQSTGFDFVDLKCCHGYLGHEFLSAYDRPGPYGGDFEGRTRFIRELIAAVQAACPGLMIGVRLSVFDYPPFRPSDDGSYIGTAETGSPPWPLFGTRRDAPFEIDLTEPIALIRRLYDDHQVKLFNITAGSPYYNPHIQRPAFYPPSDGYQPPEDPLIGCVRQMQAVHEIKQALPSDAIVIGSALSYFQEYLPHIAQGVVRDNWMDAVGIGRLVLSDWRFPDKVLKGEDIRADKQDLPHVQRLHHRPPQRPDLRLLPPRPVLQRPPRGDAGERSEGGIEKREVTTGRTVELFGPLDAPIVSVEIFCGQNPSWSVSTKRRSADSMRSLNPENPASN